MTFRTLVVVTAALGVTACTEKKSTTETKPQALAVDAGAVLAKKTWGGLTREDFNVRAQERYLPLFWRTDANGNAQLDPDELVVLLGPWDASRADFVDDHGFTAKFEDAWARITAPLPTEGLTDDEKARRALLQQELAQGKPTLVETDLRKGTDADRAAFDHFVKAAALIEKLYAAQQGTLGEEDSIPSDDTLSQAVFHRNQKAFCVAPKTEQDPKCVAIVPPPSHAVGLYPEAVQASADFCKTLEGQKNKAALMGHFSVVEADGKGFKAVPFTEAWKGDMESVAVELEAAAAAFGDDEAALKTYLTEAAKSFRTNDWEPANAAWVAMNAQNSKWYLRVAPDEVYSEPCRWKAGFALQLARINPASLEWQKKLDPVKGEMEKTLAGFAGAPYKARNVQFKLPDFIDVTLNAADQRNPHGATVGQSLPNWGPVAEKGGRTVVMSNLYTDADSRKALEQQFASLACKDTFAQFSTEPEHALVSVVLHEASHNLGPAHDYKVKGKEDDEVFGGPLASMMEELKAQSAALYFTWWLVDHQLLTEAQAKQAALRDVAWAFGHISRGMYDAEKHGRPYSQLASVQMGSMLRASALVWKPDALAANGKDQGCFEVDLVKWRPAVTTLVQRVAAAKGKGDKKDAEAMKAAFVDAEDDWSKLRETISERWLRAPKATFVYAVDR